jgi:hypothetical protein
MKREHMAPDYTAFLSAVKGRIHAARLQAGRAVNRELVMLYWDIESGIVERQEGLGWGDAVVARFAADLRAEFPDMHGFSRANVWRMRQFFGTDSASEFLAQLARELRKMDFYLNLQNKKERGPDDRPSIGIILGAEKDDVEAHVPSASRLLARGDTTVLRAPMRGPFKRWETR